MKFRRRDGMQILHNLHFTLKMYNKISSDRKQQLGQEIFELANRNDSALSKYVEFRKKTWLGLTWLT